MVCVYILKPLILECKICGGISQLRTSPQPSPKERELIFGKPKLVSGYYFYQLF